MSLLTVVVAEQDPAERQRLTALLAPEGYRLISFGDGGELLNYLRHFTPELIILNAALPVVSGLEICAKLKRSRRLAATRVILLAAPEHYQRVGEAARAIKVDLVLAQPPRQLRQRVRELLWERGEAPLALTASATQVCGAPCERGALSASSTAANSAAARADAKPSPLVDELHRLRVQLARLEQENAQLKEAVPKSIHHALQTHVAALEHEVDQLRRELAAQRQLRDESEQLKRALKCLTAENVALRAEFAQALPLDALEELLALTRSQTERLLALKRRQQQLLQSLGGDGVLG